MSVRKETLIYCDGEGCPMDGCYADGDSRDRSATYMRKNYHFDGWVFRRGKDYCPECAKKLAPPSLKARNDSSVATNK